MGRHPATKLVLALGLVCLAAPVAAQGLASGMINSIPDAFQNTVQRMEGPLTNVALGLLGGLALIEVAFALGMKWLDGAGTQEMLGVIVRQGLMMGLFVWLVRFGPDLSRGVILWMVQNGNTSSQAMGGSVNLSPGDVAGIGLNMVGFLWQRMSWDSPIRSMILMFAGAVILYSFAEMCAATVMVAIKGYFFAAWAALMMGFGGSAYTRDIAIGQIRLALAIGTERFVLTCIIGLGEGLMRDWGNQVRSAEFTASNIAPMIICPIIMHRLVATLPAYAHSLVSGHGHGASYGSPVKQMVSGGMAGAAAAVAGATGMGAAIAAAYDKASASVDGGGGGGGGAGGGAGGGSSGSSGSIASAARSTAMAARNLGQAAVADVGKRMRGDYAANHGYLGHRMAASMRSDAASMRDAAQQNQGTT